MNLPEAIASCQGSQCRSFRPGHHVHPIHAKRVGHTPWGWRDAVVTRIDGLKVSLAYLNEPGAPDVWHHRPHLADALAVADPVRLHEQYYVVGSPSGWYSVVIDGGIGAVPEPDDLGAWLNHVSGGVVDLRTGIALATDHLPRG